MFRGFLNSVLGASREPEIVLWSPNTRGHSQDERGGKDIIHGDIILGVSSPSFSKEMTWVYVVVSNMGRKALGFGSSGFGLVVTTGGARSTITCQSLTEQSRGQKRVKMEDERHSQEHHGRRGRVWRSQCSVRGAVPAA